MDNDLSITYSTPSDREGVVAEIWTGTAQAAEICGDSGRFSLEIYPQKSGHPWKFRLADFKRILIEAANGLGQGDLEDKDKTIADLQLQIKRLSGIREKETEDDRRALLSAVS